MTSLIFSTSRLLEIESESGSVKASVKEELGKLRFFDISGAEITLAEIHRRTQLEGEVQRSVYNLRMTYGHFGRNIDSTGDENA
jgi:hypothetical protein